MGPKILESFCRQWKPGEMCGKHFEKQVLFVSPCLKTEVRFLFKSNDASATKVRRAPDDHTTNRSVSLIIRDNVVL